LVERTTGVATHVIVEAAATACMAFAGVGVAIARADDWDDVGGVKNRA